MDYKKIFYQLIEDNHVTYEEAVQVILSALAPPSGGNVASRTKLQNQYDKSQAWRRVQHMMYGSTGRCVDCGTRLGLQFDHIIPRSTGDDPSIYNVSNLTFRCGRCNSTRHLERGSTTDMPTQATLMFILVTKKPDSYSEFLRLAREEGLTCGTTRVKEAWAYAIWRWIEGSYEIKDLQRIC